MKLYIIACLIMVGVMPAQVTPRRNVLPGSLRRDPDAIRALSDALDMMGGNGWAQVFDAHATGAVAGETNVQATARVVWDDAWIQGRLWFRREAHLGSDAVVRTSDPDIGSFVQRGGHIEPVPKQADEFAYPMHLPAVALLEILRSPDYAVWFLMPPTGGNPDPLTIRTVRFRNGLAIRATQLDWQLASATHQLQSVTLQLRDLLNQGHTFPQLFEYRSFSWVGSLSVPSDLRIGLAGGRAMLVHLDHISLNNSLPHQEFAPAK